ncbi:protein FAM8A1 [Condylostylus longicornis]|uniref:protein FAM8A1 n=1 Tax=Condylostylus longicornis TaxID=2530218 RepID=UPI00244DB49C|nr:protein FAM8A1 [Condylostylus longicornis]
MTEAKKDDCHDGNIGNVGSFDTQNSKEVYFQVLRTWINQANMAQSAMAYFPYYLMTNYSQLLQQNSNNSTPNINNFATSNNNGRINEIDGRLNDIADVELRQEQIINQNGGYEFIIAPFWKRLLAETIDVAILLLLKLIITFLIVDLFDLDLGIDFDLDALKKSIEDDYTEFLSLSSDLLFLEVVTKVGVCIYEALWTMNGNVYVGGATPGKVLLGLRIVHVEAVVPLQAQVGLNLNNGQPMRALLYPASNLGFRRAFLRAIAKNILTAFLFPMCFIMIFFFFKSNRTIYDLMSKTIVVEENHAPLLRRR